MNIKVKRADLLKGTELETFKQLGGDAEAEVEVSLADFIKGIVADAITSAFEAKAAEDAAKAAEAEAAALAEAEAKAAEDSAKAAEAEAAALAEAEAKAAEDRAGLDELKSLVAELKALAV